ncbi:MAG TPA: RpiB/LacA/LacB family sugar-phosphate isomerase, partial [Dehalococcoidia bacterium]|nr:RpiB/LacA/LacB family sugar-phosphate isomerase [Dehalococcoidia bacterium]
MRVAVGSDHAGFRLKEFVKQYLRERGHEVDDFGTDSEASVDYPDYARP